MKADEIIAEIKALSPDELAEVSAFMLQAELDDPALKIALDRKTASASGVTKSIPYEQSRSRAMSAIKPKPGR